MIDKNKKYTSDGHKVTIVSTDLRASVYPVLAIIHERYLDIVETFTQEGFCYAGNSEYSKNLKEVQPWADFKIDDPVLVRRAGDKVWTKRHFAGLTPEGKPTTWLSGSTSWTSGHHDGFSVWDEMERPL